MPQSTITSTTQDFLDIHDITNDIVFMKDGSAAAILAVNAMNFSLLAEEEQDAVIYAYAALLNSLNFQIQINIQSRTKDATAYLDLLKKQEETVSSADKRKRIARYREFVGDLIQERNVLDKKFYVVIPAAAIEMGLLPPQSVLPGAKPLDISSIEKSTLLEKAMGLLGPRVDHLVGQFGRIGLYARKLATQEIIQNFYTNYNPEAVEGQQITESEDYTTPLVQASLFSATLQNRTQTIKQFSQNPASSLTEATQPAVAQPLVQPEISTEAQTVAQPAPAAVETFATETLAVAPDQPSPEQLAQLSVETTQPYVDPNLTQPLPAMESPTMEPVAETSPLPVQSETTQTETAPVQAEVTQVEGTLPEPASVTNPSSQLAQPAPTTQSAYSLPPLPEIT